MFTLVYLANQRSINETIDANKPCLHIYMYIPPPSSSSPSASYGIVLDGPELIVNTLDGIALDGSERSRTNTYKKLQNGPERSRTISK